MIIGFKYNNIIVTQYNAHDIFHSPLTFGFIKYTYATATFYNYTVGMHIIVKY